MNISIIINKLEDFYKETSLKPKDGNLELLRAEEHFKAGKPTDFLNNIGSRLIPYKRLKSYFKDNSINIDKIISDKKNYNIPKEVADVYFYNDLVYRTFKDQHRKIKFHSQKVLTFIENHNKKINIILDYVSNTQKVKNLDELKIFNKHKTDVEKYIDKIKKMLDHEIEFLRASISKEDIITLNKICINYNKINDKLEAIECNSIEVVIAEQALILKNNYDAFYKNIKCLFEIDNFYKDEKMPIKGSKNNSKASIVKKTIHKINEKYDLKSLENVICNEHINEIKKISDDFDLNNKYNHFHFELIKYMAEFINEARAYIGNKEKSYKNIEIILKINEKNEKLINQLYSSFEDFKNDTIFKGTNFFSDYSNYKVAILSNLKNENNHLSDTNEIMYTVKQGEYSKEITKEIFNDIAIMIIEHNSIKDEIISIISSKKKTILSNIYNKFSGDFELALKYVIFEIKKINLNFEATLEFIELFKNFFIKSKDLIKLKEESSNILSSEQLELRKEIKEISDKFTMMQIIAIDENENIVDDFITLEQNDLINVSQILRKLPKLKIDDYVLLINNLVGDEVVTFRDNEIAIAKTILAFCYQHKLLSIDKQLVISKTEKFKLSEGSKFMLGNSELLDDDINSILNAISGKVDFTVKTIKNLINMFHLYNLKSYRNSISNPSNKEQIINDVRIRIK